MLRGSVFQTKIQTRLCASISPKAPTSQFIRRPSSIPSPKGSTPDHVKNSASILHKRFTSLHLPTILLKLVVHFTLDSAPVKALTPCTGESSRHPDATQSIPPDCGWAGSFAGRLRALRASVHF